MREAMNRRRFLRAATVAGGSIVLSAPAGTAFAARRSPGGHRRRVYVIVVDGLRNDEITGGLMPNLTELIDQGTRFANARALPVAETLPNHVMMAAGRYPNRTGVPGNSAYDAAEGEVRTLGRASDLRGPTMLDRAKEAGLTSGSVLSKDYLYGIFGTRATYRWEPEPIIPVSDHAPDVFTRHALLAMIDEADPDLVFCSLGDCDRAGHVDLTGTTVQAVRSAAVWQADQALGALASRLRSTDRWQESVVMVLADHSMDWSSPWALISLQPVMDRDPMLAGNVVISQNGGADLLYWTGPERERAEARRRMAELAGGVDGVLSVHEPAELALGPEAGEVVAFCRAGWRFSDPRPWSNPIPGNHGHPATEPIPFVISGGDPIVRSGVAAPGRAVTPDVAPTVGALLGIAEPDGGYDGRVLGEAFTALPSDSAADRRGRHGL
ncbi:alkaline phosphatase family protein [Haloechinothrix sp. LS1_15]|nr:alkaline phosphatase family protein [Haloechinothrix sp. LS1_15]